MEEKDFQSRSEDLQVSAFFFKHKQKVVPHTALERCLILSMVKLKQKDYFFGLSPSSYQCLAMQVTHQLYEC